MTLPQDRFLYIGDHCRLCGEPKIEWHDALLCGLCDGPWTDDPPCWLIAWVDESRTTEDED